MPVCGFCGHENRDDARSCVSCGYVFVEAERAVEPAVETPAVETTAAAPAALAGLFEPETVARPARQAVVMTGLAAVLAAAVAVGIVLDAASALDEVRARAFLVDPPSLTPRADVLALAELSILVGALVMLGGWSQQVAAARALLDVTAPRHTPAWALRAWLVPVANVILPGRLVRELWEDGAPPGGTSPPPRVVRLWPALFGVALAARHVALVPAFLAFDLRTETDVVLLTAALVVPLVLWIAALAVTALVVRALTLRQVARAELLVAASG